MTDSSDFERRVWELVRPRNLAIHGPEEMDLNTIQGLDQAATDRLQCLKATREATARRVLRDAPPLDHSYYADGEFFACFDLETPIIEAAFDLFTAIVREYLEVVRDTRQFEWLLDETRQRVTNYARNRLIEIATGSCIEKWTSLPTPNEAEVGDVDLWEHCEKVGKAVWYLTGRSSNWHKAEAWERHFDDEALAPVESLPALTVDSSATDRQAAVDAFLQQCNAMAGPGVKILRLHIWEDVGHSTGRQFQRWQSCDPKATDADNVNFPRILSDPAGFVARFKKKQPV